jgi:hypothetical protein
MNKKIALKFVNIIIAILILSQAVTAVLSDLIGRDAFEILHGIGGTLLLLGVFLHVVLNWGWVHSAFFKKG